MKGLAITVRSFFLPALLATVVFASFSVQEVAAQDETFAEAVRSSATPYVRLGAGASVSETDINRFAVEPYAFLTEIGYQFSPYISLGVGHQFGQYPRFDPDPGQLHILQGWLRYTVLAHRSFTHYLQIGGHATLGGDTFGSGLGLAIGLDQMISRRTSVFVESNFNFIFPDDAVESITSGRARFSALGFLGVGTRVALRPAAIPPRVQAIDGPALLERGQTGAFDLLVNDDATEPITYHWDFGDGTEGRGKTADHAYLLEGDYTITVTAENRGGRSTETLRITVDEAPLAARIVNLYAAPYEIDAGQKVSFDAVIEGSSDLTYTWNFGDGSPAASNLSAHRFSEERNVGSLGLEPSVSHTYLRPGTYEIELYAQNRHGSDRRTMTITVRPDPCDTLELEPVYFEFAQTAITAEARATLERNADKIAGCPDRLIQLDGYADYVGGDAFNALLTMRRSLAVERNYAELGIDRERFIDRGLGRVADEPCPEEARDRGCRIHRRVDSFLIRDDRPVERRLQTSR